MLLKPRQKASSLFDYKTFLNPLLLYSSIIFVIGLTDSIMSYATPIFIEEHLNSTLTMGFILSFSSIVGAFCDFIFSKYFHGKKFQFFLILGIIGTFFFPTVMVLFPPFVIAMLLAMLIWGIYFELIIFSNFHFVHSFMGKNEHAKAFGILETFKACAYLVGPIIASNLLPLNTGGPFYLSMFFSGVALFFALLFLKYYRLSIEDTTNSKHMFNFSFHNEIKIWSVLFKRVWPLYLFIFMLNVIDSSFWSIGTLLSEEIKSSSGLGGLLLSAYTAPSLIMGLLAGKIAQPFGKKRASLLSGLFAGLLLILSGTIDNSLYFILVIFIASLFISMSWPQMMATFEDYIIRLGEFGNDIVGLQSSSSSLSYIIGPIFASAVASTVGNKLTFSVMGILLLFVSLIILLILPRKIRMPMVELEEIKE